MILARYEKNEEPLNLLKNGSFSFYVKRKISNNDNQHFLSNLRIQFAYFLHNISVYILFFLKFI